MVCIRKILLINILGMMIIIVASVSFAGMGGGGHHMPNSNGYMNNPQNQSIPKTDQRYNQFNTNSNMHRESGNYNMHDQMPSEGMRQNNYYPKQHDSPNSGQGGGNSMDNQQHENQMDMH